MRLHIESEGQGPDLVLLHGWGLHGGIWGSAIGQLGQRFRLHRVDLPGHGFSLAPEGEYTMATIVETLAAELPAGAHWLGWSLGGRIALAAAAAGVAIERLILVGTNPSFIQREGWPHGMAETELENFVRQLREDYRATLLRFVALQSRGSSQGREELRALRSELFSHGEPSGAALAGGLELLRGTDLRPQLPKIKLPTLVLHGERDRLAPIEAAEYTAAALPNGRLQVIEGAGHAPFLSHPQPFLQAVEGFLL